MDVVALQQWVPWVLASGNIASAVLTGRRRLSGWTVLAATQLLFIAYAVLTAQWGFLPQNIAMTTVAVINHRTWSRQDRANPRAGGDVCGC